MRTVFVVMLFMSMFFLGRFAMGSECNVKGMSCLFIDASGCTLDCGDALCASKGPKCVFGFGVSAKCWCNSGTPSPKPA